MVRKSEQETGVAMCPNNQWSIIINKNVHI